MKTFKPWNYLKSPTVLKYGLTLSLIGGLASSLSFNPDSQMIARGDLMQNEHTIGLASNSFDANGPDINNPSAYVAGAKKEDTPTPEAQPAPRSMQPAAATPPPAESKDVYVTGSDGAKFCISCLNQSMQNLETKLTTQISELVTALKPAAKPAETATTDDKDKSKKHDKNKVDEKYADFKTEVTDLSRACDNDDLKDLKKSSSRLSIVQNSSPLDSVDWSSIQSCASDNLSDLLQKCEDDEGQLQIKIADAKDDKDKEKQKSADEERKAHAKICTDEIKHMVSDVSLPAIKIGLAQLSTSDAHKYASQMAADLLGKLSDYLNSDAVGLKHIVDTLALQANREIDQEAAASDRAAAQLIYNKDVQSAVQQCQMQAQMQGASTPQVQAACNSAQTIAAINKAASQDTLNQLGSFANAEGTSLRGFAQQIAAGTSDTTVMSAFAQNYYSPIQTLLNSLIAGSNGQQVNGLAALGSLQPGQAAIPCVGNNCATNNGLGTNAAAARIFTSNQAIPLFNANGSSLLTTTDPNLSLNNTGLNNNLFNNVLNVNNGITNNGLSNGAVAVPTVGAAGTNVQVRSAGGTGGTISIH